MSTIVDGEGLFVQAAGCEEAVRAETGGAMVLFVEVDDLVGDEDEAEDFRAQFGRQVEEAEGLERMGYVHVGRDVG